MISFYKILDTLFYSYHSFFYWRDALEILFFSGVIYYICLWLQKDKQKKLLLYFYSYAALLVSCHYLQLTTINHVLLIATPIIAFLFIIVHQQSLQKNIVALHNITPALSDNNSWLEIFIQSCLVAINKKKTMTFVIEHKDNLSDFLSTKSPFQANIQYDLLNILIGSSLYDQEKMIWLTTEGKLVGPNSLWTQNIEKLWLEKSVKLVEKWHQQAVFFTSRLDALILRLNPKDHTFTIVVNGMTLNNMQATNTLLFIKNYIVKDQTVSFNNKGNSYYDRNKKTKISEKSTS